MSSRNTSASSVSATKPYCKVCYDAGRPEKEYTSHFVKDQPGPQGKVICPTLLNQACRICNKTGHTSSYCPQYRHREEPRREERYIDREPRREERYYYDRNPYDRLRDDTERRERETRERDEVYYREQDRRSKPWLQVALKPAQEQSRRQPYAHPHGPRVRLNLETTALCASKHVALEQPPALPAIDIRKVNLNHASNWGDEDNEQPFVCDPEKMTREFMQECIMANLTTSEEHDFIAECDNQGSMPFYCGH